MLGKEGGWGGQPYQRPTYLKTATDRPQREPKTKWKIPPAADPHTIHMQGILSQGVGNSQVRGNVKALKSGRLVPVKVGTSATA